MVRLTHLEKIYWKKGSITKGEMVAYYTKIAKYILRYLKGRPLVMHRFPDGVSKPGFFQKEAGENIPSFVKTAKVQHAGKKISYLLVENLNTLQYVANLGSIELHPFSSRTRNLEKPDYLVFDLDPESISFDRVIDTAIEIHQLLDKINVPNFCKTTGGRGLHIYVPLKGKYGYLEAKAFSQCIAKLIHEKIPSFTSLARLPQKRKKKVYIDCLQNAKGQTLVAPYSLKALPDATVSTPLSWAEVKRGLNPKKFTLKTVLKRVSQKGDLFKGVLARGANLKNALRELEKKHLH